MKLTHEEIKAEQERLALEEKSDWEWLLSDERGKRIVYRLIERCGVLRCAFQGNALNTAFSEGQRNEGIFLVDRVARFAPEAFTEIMRLRYEKLRDEE